MRPYERAGIEPDFHELLADPVLHAVLARDGIDEDTVKAVVRAARIRLGLASPCELVASEEEPELRGRRMPAISGGHDGAGRWTGAGRCLTNGPLRLKCA
jgi:hypothetical protein